MSGLNEEVSQQQEITAALQILGYVYPAYLCFKDVDRGKPDRLKLWCMYWCVGDENGCIWKLVCASFAQYSETNKRGRFPTESMQVHNLYITCNYNAGLLWRC